MSLSDQVAALEADRDALKFKCEDLMRRLQTQMGAIAEGRGERDSLRKVVQRQAVLIGRYQDFLSKLFHSTKDLEQAKANAKEVMPGAKPSHVATVAGAGSRNRALNCEPSGPWSPNGLKPQPSKVASLTDRIRKIGGAA